MNKFGVLIALLAITLASCTNQNKKQNTAQEESQMIDSRISKSSLDWVGAYEGTLPCADCEGIQTVIELNQDNTYNANYLYLGKSENENKFTDTGSFTWDILGNNITLESQDEKSQYKVEKNQLVLLDEEGEITTGKLGNSYLLKKTK